MQGGVIMLPLACSLSYVVLKHMRLFLVPCFVSALVPSPKNSILPPAPPHTHWSTPLPWPPPLPPGGSGCTSAPCDTRHPPGGSSDRGAAIHTQAPTRAGADAARGAGGTDNKAWRIGGPAGGRGWRGCAPYTRMHARTHLHTGRTHMHAPEDTPRQVLRLVG